MAHKDEHFKNPLNRSGGVIMTKAEARESMKNLQAQAVALEPTALIELFEIDLSNILSPDKIKKRQKFNELNLLMGGTLVDDPFSSSISIFRFHNNVKLIKRDLWFQGNRYKAFPCKAEGFETNSTGPAASPKLSFGSRPEALSRFAVLKELLKDLDDLVGAKVTRLKTFSKFLDYQNWYQLDSDGNPDLTKRLYQDIPSEITPDENAFFPPDLFFIEKKSYEDKKSMQFELSSYVNFEGLQLPQRIFNMKRCTWHYRSAGCTYEYQFRAQAEGWINAHEHFEGTHLPKHAPPIATENDELISEISPGYNPISANTPHKWSPNTVYFKDDIVFIVHDKKSFYFVAKHDVPQNTPPPNYDHWVADQCSKTFNGCRLRWGVSSTPVQMDANHPKKGILPFGAFPSITREGGRS